MIARSAHLTALGLAVAVSGLFAQARGPEGDVGDLAGRVLDVSSGAPVEGALVEIEVTFDQAAAGRRALTDGDGSFRLTSVPAGLLTLRVEHIAYGVHRQALQVEGTGEGVVEITLSPTAIVLEPITVEASASVDLARRASPSSRNVFRREAIAQAAVSGLTLGAFLSREIPGIYARRSPELGGAVCLEFRGARRGEETCRPPQVYLDGTSVPNPSDFFGYFSLEGLEQIRVVSPSEAGTRYGPNSGWGVVLLETRRTGRDGQPEVPVVRRRPGEPELVDWSFEPTPYPWVRSYSTAFAGNALGLVAASSVLSQCMDLETRRFYRGSNACGAGLLLASGVLMSILPPLGGALGARLAGATPRSRGRLGRSILYSLPVFVPGFAIASTNAGSGAPGGVELLGIALVALGAPALNVVADRKFRTRR